MLEAVRSIVDREPAVLAPNVVICGSFRRGLDQLRRDRDALLACGCVVLSPTDLGFIREDDGFVLAAHELGLDPRVIEEKHVTAIRSADFVWLHLPDGYLGASGAFELGAAVAGGVPVFARETPRDVGLRAYVRPAAAPPVAVADVREAFVADPGAGIRHLQTYYGRVAARRGWSHETPAETLKLLVGEVVELREALERHSTVPVSPESDVGAELADVQLYVVHMANVLAVDLGAAVTSKEAVNALRFEAGRSSAA